MLTTKEFIELARKKNICIERKHVVCYLKVYGTSNALNIYALSDLVSTEISYDDMLSKFSANTCKA